MSCPHTVAIVMDGNRRWAKKNNLPSASGHRKGIETLIDIVKTAKNNSIKRLVVYAFSTENWSRENFEVNALMNLINFGADVKLDEIKANGIKLTFIGDIENMPKKAKEGISKCIDETKNLKEFNLITKKYDAVRRCTNVGFECEKMAVEKIKHFISKEALNIDGLGKKVVEKFWDLKLIRFPQDIFNLDYTQISKLEGWGDLSVSNLKFSIDQSKKVPLDKFLYSIGIRHIGIENAKLLAEYTKSISNFLNFIKNKKINEFLNIDGIGDTQINSLKKFFENKSNYKIIEKLSSILNIYDFKLNKTGKLLNNSFMFTGKLSNMSRAEAKSLIEENSGSVVSSVNKKLKYLIIGEKPTNRKVEQAKELGIKILSEKEWLNLLN